MSIFDVVMCIGSVIVVSLTWKVYMVIVSFCDT